MDSVNKQDDAMLPADPYAAMNTVDLIEPEKRHSEAYFYVMHVLEFVVPMAIQHSQLTNTAR